MNNRNLYLTAIAAAVLLSACGGDKDSASKIGEPAPGSVIAAAAAQAEEKAAAAAIPKPDMSKPLASYPELTSGQQAMFMYVATSKMPPDFDRMAQTYSRDYRQTNDAFRKNDLLKALQPQLEQGIAQAAAEPYAWVSLSGADLRSYDFERQGFMVTEFASSINRYFNDAQGYQYTWVNRDQVAFAPVVDEAVAREIESLRGNWNTRPHLRIYFFAQSADLNAQRINAYVTRVQITDRNGRVLAEYGPEGA